jgi:hypothetical protein
VGRAGSNDRKRADQQLRWKSKHFRFNTGHDVEFAGDNVGFTRNFEFARQSTEFASGAAKQK